MNKILIIEDHPQMRCKLAMILEREQFQVTTAPNGLIGLDMARSDPPDLVVCDIMMPVMDGHAFFALLKQDKMLAFIPFIFVTALGRRDDIRKGMAAGVDDYLTKPFSAEELVSAVCGRLARVRALRQDASRTSLKQDAEWLRNLITKREIEVLLLVGGGTTSRQIAEQLGISIRTVENHRTHLMEKLNVTNAVALSHWAIVARQL